MLVPMEKIGLIQREASDRDARVSYAAITTTGTGILQDAFTTAIAKAKEIIPPASVKQFAVLADLLGELGAIFPDQYHLLLAWFCCISGYL